MFLIGCPNEGQQYGKRSREAKVAEQGPMNNFRKTKRTRPGETGDMYIYRIPYSVSQNDSSSSSDVW